MKRTFPFIIKSGCWYIIFIFFILFPVNGENLKPFVMPSARASGFGGIHAAQGDDFSAIFSNPASFAGIEKQFSAAEISISVYGPVFELFDTAIQNSGDVSPIIDTEGFAAGFDIGGPIAIGFVSNGFGFGFFNRSVADFKTVDFGGNLFLVPSVWEEILLVGGYSFRILDRDKHSINIGFLGKAFYRIMFDLEARTDDLSSLISNADIMPLETQFGVGLDVGIKYCYKGNFTAALVGYDVYSPALVTSYAQLSDLGDNGSQSYNTIQPRLALGVLYHLRNDFFERYFERYIEDIVLLADYADVVDLFKKDRRNPLLNISLGMEITMLRVLKLRVGMAELLPAGGFGIDMKFMTMDMAVRGKQLGKKPGEKSVFALDLGLLFRY